MKKKTNLRFPILIHEGNRTANGTATESGGGKMSEFSGQKLLINQEDHCQVCPARPPQEHQLEGEAVGASV